jgi:hypothetical protein
MMCGQRTRLSSARGGSGLTSSKSETSPQITSPLWNGTLDCALERRKQLPICGVPADPKSDLRIRAVE